MSEYTIFIHAKPYIVKYFREVYGVPAKFPKKSFYNSLIGKFLIKPKDNYNVKLSAELAESDSHLQISLPYFSHKDIRTYNQISVTGENFISSQLRQDFYLALMLYVKDFLSGEFLSDKTPYVNTAIKSFIEKYELNVDCFSTLLKQYHRTETTRSKKKRKHIIKLN